MLALLELQSETQLSLKNIPGGDPPPVTDILENQAQKCLKILVFPYFETVDHSTVSSEATRQPDMAHILTLSH